MMEHIFTIVWLSIGVLIGGFGVWALLKTKVQTEYERGKSEANTEVSVLRERVASRERELNQTTQTLQQHSADLERLRDELRSETERRAASEQHNTYIPTLKSELSTREGEVRNLQEAISASRSRQAGLETRLEDERHAKEETLVRLRGVETELSARSSALDEQRDAVARLNVRIAELKTTAEQAESSATQRQEQLSALESKLQDRDNELNSLRPKLAELETTLQQERSAAQEKLALLDEAQQKLSDAFKALSAEALRSNNTSFLELAKATLEKYQEAAKGDLDKGQQAISELVKPVRESLEKFDSKVNELEKAREGAYQGLSAQVRSLLDTQTHLRTETSKLVQALRTPVVRGRWGEIQLRRVVEMAGMLNRCDFFEQQSIASEEGTLRPDLLVQLPGGKIIIVDAKAPLSAYLEAVEASDEEIRRMKMAEHATQIRSHMTALARKAYWEQFESTPEFVVLFLPGEAFFSAALEHDPSLIEFGVDQQVIIATPTTLIALLRAVAYGWRQESITQNAKDISDLGRELYKRISDMGSHWERVGRNLGNAVTAYNQAVGSLEARVFVTARKFKELEAASESVQIPEVAPLESSTRTIQAPEFAMEG